VAQPPPIRLVPLHPNTMGDAANIRFCQSHRWGQVIEGGSADVTKKRFFTHDNQLGCGSLHRQWRCHPQFPPPLSQRSSSNSSSAPNMAVLSQDPLLALLSSYIVSSQKHPTSSNPSTTNIINHHY
jgi:hypothetical protein